MLCFSKSAFAEVLHWPELCSNGTLLVQNHDTQKTSVWLQKFTAELDSETEYELEPGQEQSISVDRLEGEHFSLLHFARKIDARFSCGKSIFATSAIEGGVFTFEKKDIEHLWLQNLYTDTNSVEIEYLNKSFQKMYSEKLELKSLASRDFALADRLHNWEYLKVSSSNRLASFALGPLGSVHPLLARPQLTSVDADSSYFLVAARTGASDSFVVKIKDPALITMARDLIKNPQKEKMLFAKIKKNHQGFNRNFSSPQKNLWSWSTTEVTNFGDLGSTACNGAPQLLEDRVDGWVGDPGQICFWNFRVKKELSAADVASGSLSKKKTNRRH